jgi:diguanylate cyclase (GGDEF)-like protein
MLGRSVRVLVPADGDRAADDIARRVHAGEQIGHFETRRLRKDGTLVDVSVTNSPIRAEDGTVIGVSKIARDIGERLATERRLAHEATHDSLTGLPNRRFLRDTLAEALRAHDHHQSCFGVFYIDLDGFKAVNDAQGHDAGDRLLVQTAERLRCVLRPGDFVARIGGDEFVVLAYRVRTDIEALELGSRLTSALRSSVDVGAFAREVSASIGVALYPGHGQTADELLLHADRGLYAAKRAGRDRVVIYAHRH